MTLLGTKIGVLLVNMVSPKSPTQQLQEKYTHESVDSLKEHYKYDITDLGLELLNRKEQPIEKAKQYQV